MNSRRCFRKIGKSLTKHNWNKNDYCVGSLQLLNFIFKKIKQPIRFVRHPCCASRLFCLFVLAALKRIFHTMEMNIQCKNHRSSAHNFECGMFDRVVVGGGGGGGGVTCTSRNRKTAAETHNSWKVERCTGRLLEENKWFLLDTNARSSVISQRKWSNNKKKPTTYHNTLFIANLCGICSV